MNWRIDFNNLNIVNFDNSPVHVIRVNGQDAWTDGVIVHFMVGDVEFTNQMVSKGGHSTRPTTDPVVEGYTFVGWSADGLTLVDFDNFEINEEMYIHAALSQDLYEAQSSYQPVADRTFGSCIRISDKIRLLCKYVSSVNVLYLLNEERKTCEILNDTDGFSSLCKINDRYFLALGSSSASKGLCLFDSTTFTHVSLHQYSPTYRSVLPDGNMLFGYNFSSSQYSYVFDMNACEMTFASEDKLLYTANNTSKEYDDYYMITIGGSGTKGFYKYYKSTHRIEAFNTSYASNNYKTPYVSNKGDMIYLGTKSIIYLNDETQEETEITSTNGDNYTTLKVGFENANGDMVLHYGTTSSKYGTLFLNYQAKTLTKYFSGTNYDQFAEMPDGKIVFNGSTGTHYVDPVNLTAGSIASGDGTISVRYNCLIIMAGDDVGIWNPTTKKLTWANVSGKSYRVSKDFGDGILLVSPDYDRYAIMIDAINYKVLWREDYWYEVICAIKLTNGKYFFVTSHYIGVADTTGPKALFAQTLNYEILFVHEMTNGDILMYGADPNEGTGLYVLHFTGEGTATKTKIYDIYSNGGLLSAINLSGGDVVVGLGKTRGALRINVADYSVEQVLGLYTNWDTFSQTNNILTISSTAYPANPVVEYNEETKKVSKK